MHPSDCVLPLDADTQALRKALWRYRIGHRITTEDDAQVLWVADPGQRDALLALVARWQQGEPLELAEHASPAQAPALFTTLQAATGHRGHGGDKPWFIFALIGVFGRPINRCAYHRADRYCRR